MIGKVKWFDSKKGYGFILTEEGREVFVHYTGIVAEGFRAVVQLVQWPRQQRQQVPRHTRQQDRIAKRRQDARPSALQWNDSLPDQRDHWHGLRQWKNQAMQA